MPDPFKTKRGLFLTLQEAEIFCSLDPGQVIENINDQREIAAQLAIAYETGKNGAKINQSKYIQYLIHAAGEKALDVFTFDWYDIFSWYTTPRLFISALNRLTSILKLAFLPIWYPILGLSYLIQAAYSHHDHDKERRNYWAFWLAVNVIGCLSILLVGGSITLLTALPLLIGYACDVIFDIYKYFKEISVYKSLLIKLADNEHLESELEIKLAAKKKDKKINIATSSIILLGGLTYILSILLPPLFIGMNVVGASLILGTMTFILLNRIRLSWSNKQGFLHHYLRKPLLKLGSYLQQHVNDFIYGKAPVGLHDLSVLQIPDAKRNEITTVCSLEASSSTSSLLFSPDLKHSMQSPDSIVAASPTPSLSPPKSSTAEDLFTSIQDKIKFADNISEELQQLNAEERIELRKRLHLEKDSDWQRQIELWGSFYGKERKIGSSKKSISKQHPYYYCSIERAIQVKLKEINKLRISSEELQQRTGESTQDHAERFKQLIATNEQINTEVKFLNAMTIRFYGTVNERAIDERLSTPERKHLISLLGVHDWDKQKKYWGKYYQDERPRIGFFDKKQGDLHYSSFERVIEKHQKMTG